MVVCKSKRPFVPYILSKMSYQPITFDFIQIHILINHFKSTEYHIFYTKTFWIVLINDTPHPLYNLCTSAALVSQMARIQMCAINANTFPSDWHFGCGLILLLCGFVWGQKVSTIIYYFVIIVKHCVWIASPVRGRGSGVCLVFMHFTIVVKCCVHIEQSHKALLRITSLGIGSQPWLIYRIKICRVAWTRWHHKKHPTHLISASRSSASDHLSFLRDRLRFRASLRFAHIRRTSKYIQKGNQFTSARTTPRV